jgi:predicted transcriptional regulator
MVSEINHRLAAYNHEFGNGIRIEALEYLQAEDEANLKSITDFVGRSSSTMSKHMKSLADYDVVRSETRGRNKFFSLKRPELVEAYLDIRSLLQRDDDT